MDWSPHPSKMSNCNGQSDEQCRTPEAGSVGVSGAEDHSDQDEGQDELHAKSLGLSYSVRQVRHGQVVVLGVRGESGREEEKSRSRDSGISGCSCSNRSDSGDGCSGCYCFLVL